MGAVEELLELLPEELSGVIRETEHYEQIEEIRLRIGQAPGIVRQQTEQALSGIVSNRQLQTILSAASGFSSYAVQHDLQKGFLTVSGGHRIGICGTAVYDGGQLQSIRDISSLAIRVARACPGCANVILAAEPFHSALVIGMPGSGKTTLIRDLIRQLSDTRHVRISLLDERQEIAASFDGVPQLYVGRYTDVLSSCDKASGMMMVLRSMSPQLIAMDEITTPEDIEAICRCVHCGVRILATAHAEDREDLMRRPLYQKLMAQKVFDCLITVGPQHKCTAERVDLLDA